MSNSPPHIVKETIYNHKPRDAAVEREFSFLMDTYENRNEVDDVDVETFLGEIREISESLSLRMDRMDRELTRQIEKQTKGSIGPHYRQALAPRGIMNINTENEGMFGCKELLLENRQFDTSSNFEIDEHQNFVKLKNSANMANLGRDTSGQVQGRTLPVLNVTRMQRVQDERQYPKAKKQAPPAQPAAKPSHSRRIYESILEKFTTASLIAMNRDQC